MRSIPNLLIAIVVALTLSGCTMNDKGQATTAVAAKDNQFEPNTLSLKENAKITVKNEGDNLHSVTVHKAGDPATQTKKDTDIAKGTSTEYTFDESGTFHVYCKYHSGGAAGSFGSGMVLTVTVTEG